MSDELARLIQQVDQSLKAIVDAANPGTRGENAFDLRDATGKCFMRSIVDGAKRTGYGWEDYWWTNHVTGQKKMKSAYYELVDGLVVACAIYKGARPRTNATNSALSAPRALGKLTAAH